MVLRAFAGTGFCFRCFVFAPSSAAPSALPSAGLQSQDLGNPPAVNGVDAQQSRELASCRICPSGDARHRLVSLVRMDSAIG